MSATLAPTVISQPSSKRFKRILMLSLVLVVALTGAVLALGLYPNDLHGLPRTRAGQIHHAATLLAFACAYMTVAEATPLLAASVTDALSPALTLLKHIISAGFIAVVVTISPPLRRFFGVAERLFLYATAIWFLTASLTLPPL